MTRLLREVIEDVPGQSPLIFLGYVMHAVVDASNESRQLKEAEVIPNIGFTGAFQESGDIFRVVQHHSLIPILSEVVEVLDEIVLRIVLVTNLLSARSGTHV